MGLEASVQCSQGPATGRCPELYMKSVVYFRYYDIKCRFVSCIFKIPPRNVFLKLLLTVNKISHYAAKDVTF
jgi:hypothetical protein